FVAARGRRLRSDPPLPLEEAGRWVDHLSADEAALDPQVALTRASLRAQERGAPAGAAGAPADAARVPARRPTDRISGLADLAGAAAAEARRRARAGLARAASAPRARQAAFALALASLIGAFAVEAATARLLLLLLAAVLLWAIEVAPS